MSATRISRRRLARSLLRRCLVFGWCLLAIALPLADNDASADEDRFFESEIRPLLVERCSRCHGAEKQSGGLRVDSLAKLLAGGERGPALFPGNVADSLILQAVRQEGDLEMPPDQPLSAREIGALTRWIEIGAPWPSAAETTFLTNDVHWAFQPIQVPDIPEVARSDWSRTPIDRFVLSRLEQEELSPSAETDRRTLIRRVTYALTGLPPTPGEVDRFAQDADPHAYEQLVERLLASPAYGEQWGRHWLDVARYSDSKGYVYAREERFWVHAWAYRDWVIQALNQDLPYNQFLRLQLAADQVLDGEEQDLAAMGYLTLGRRFLGVKRDIIDDRIDVVTRGMMGLTVSCARCHDHKYDPIPTADYYSLYGVFDSSAERLVDLPAPACDDEKEFWRELQSRREKLRARLAEERIIASERARSRVADYLRAQTELEKYPADGFDQIFAKSDLLPAFVRRWEAHLREAKQRQDPVFSSWHAFAEIPEDSFAERAADVTRWVQSATPDAVNPVVAQAFRRPPRSFDEVTQRYGAIFADIQSRWNELVEESTRNGSPPPTALTSKDAEVVRRALYGASSPCEVPDEPIVHTETLFDSDTCTELWKLQGEVDRWIIQASVPARFALTLVDRRSPSRPRIFLRGNPLNPGADVPRKFLSLFGSQFAEPFQRGSGRLELADAIVDTQNPLTARVIVNRVWAHHFGQGIVATPSDFGLRADSPSHPHLLDWLASNFVARGWSLKELHRQIVLSSTYRQSSRGPIDPDVVKRAQRKDPANRWLWHMSPRRLAFEEFRDSLLAASGEIDLARGGKPVTIFEAPFSRRRTVYGLIDRQFLPGTLRAFDFANPDLHIPQRTETTVPQQALFLMNHPLVLGHARQLAAVSQSSHPQDTVRQLFRRALQREPGPSEITEALELVEAAEVPTPRATIADWSYGYGEFDEATQRVMGFAELPHFTGKSWQGGPRWPDPQLGWLQLTAEGGHPGNDRAHACIRRWTAPRKMSIAIRSRLSHEPAAGDGIRAFMVSSRSGPLCSATIQQKTVELGASLTVEAGETVDFVVDIGDVLNSDQYQWTVTITARPSQEPAAWDSVEDFSSGVVQPLTPWEQLAHVLLCTNEFYFVD